MVGVSLERPADVKLMLMPSRRLDAHVEQVTALLAPSPNQVALRQAIYDKMQAALAHIGQLVPFGSTQTGLDLPSRYVIFVNPFPLAAS